MHYFAYIHRLYSKYILNIELIIAEIINIIKYIESSVKNGPAC